MGVGNTTRKKIALVAWNVVCKSKSQGGLGVIDLELKNKALLGKWIVRFRDPSVIGKWKDIISSKYKRIKSRLNMSLFWRGINYIKEIVDQGISWKIQKGTSTLFWTDRGLYDFSLALAYPNLFSLTANEKITVEQALSQQSIHRLFAEQPTGIALEELMKLQRNILNIHIDPAHNDYGGDGQVREISLSTHYIIGSNLGGLIIKNFIQCGNLTCLSRFKFLFG